MVVRECDTAPLDSPALMRFSTDTSGISRISRSSQAHAPRPCLYVRARDSERAVVTLSQPVRRPLRAVTH
jgi:hypothetical protein